MYSRLAISGLAALVIGCVDYQEEVGQATVVSTEYKKFDDEDPATCKIILKTLSNDVLVYTQSGTVNELSAEDLCLDFGRGNAVNYAADRNLNYAQGESPGIFIRHQTLAEQQAYWKMIKKTKKIE